MKTRKTPPSDIPAEVRAEALVPDPDTPVYWLSPSDEDVELLARGECPETVARQAHALLSWKRLQARAAAQRRQGIA